MKMPTNSNGSAGFSMGTSAGFMSGRGSMEVEEGRDDLHLYYLLLLNKLTK